jgi:hypothetical protein
LSAGEAEVIFVTGRTVAEGAFADIMLPAALWLATVDALLGPMLALRSFEPELLEPRLLEASRLEPVHALRKETAAIDNKNLT